MCFPVNVKKILTTPIFIKLLWMTTCVGKTFRLFFIYIVFFNESDMD